MKKILFLVLVLTELTAKAQYFQHTYGTKGADVLSSGINVVAPAPIGYFMAGWSTPDCIDDSLSTISVVYADADGNIPTAPFFKRNFSLISSTGVFLNARDAKAFQIPDSVGFGVIGMYTDVTLPAPNNTGIYFLQLDVAGNPLATFNYKPATGFEVLEIGGVAKSKTDSSELYITGTAIDTAGETIFAMKINMVTGAMVWSHIYDLEPETIAWGRDIEENPDTPFGFQSACIVGKIFNPEFHPILNTTQGYLFHINATNGNPVPVPMILIGLGFANESVNCINQALPSASNPSAGFVLGAVTDIGPGGPFYPIFIRTDPVGITIFSTFIQPSTFTFNTCNDVIQRFNELGQEEFYLIGSVDTSFVGISDILVLKLDQFGTPVANGEYTYGGSGRDFGQSIAIDITGALGAPIGLSIFGTFGMSAGQADFYMVKAFYNGFSGCNESINTVGFFGDFSPRDEFPTPTVTASFSAGPALMQAYSPMSDSTLCYEPCDFGR